MSKHQDFQTREGTKRLTKGAAIPKASRRTTGETERTSDKPSHHTTLALLTRMTDSPVGTTSGEVNKGIMTIRDKIPTVEMNPSRTRAAHGALITKVKTDHLMDVPSPTSGATPTKNKVMAVEEAPERTILMANARKDAAVPTAQKGSNTARTSHTSPANTRERVDRAMGVLPGPTSVRSMSTVRAPRGAAAMSMGAATATASARRATEEAANTDALVVVAGTAIALAETTNMEVRRMRATGAGLGVMGATRRARRLLAPRG